MAGRRRGTRAPPVRALEVLRHALTTERHEPDEGRSSRPDLWGAAAGMPPPTRPVKGVVPGVGALYLPALTGLDRGFIAFVGDLADHVAAGEFVAGFRRVVCGVHVPGDVVLRQG